MNQDPMELSTPAPGALRHQALERARFPGPRCPRSESALRAWLAERILEAGYPCVAARSVFNRGDATLRAYGRLGDAADAEAMAGDLADFGAASIAAVAGRGNRLVSFVAAFPDSSLASEEEFEACLWSHLALVHRFDARSHAWDESVSADPASERFSFSVGGNAYFVIGMHPKASRQSRRMPVPLLVFNPHAQFERLKASGKYNVMQDVIRDREMALQGCLNPTLTDHGAGREARQYSGRQVPEDWVCPFRAHGGAAP